MPQEANIKALNEGFVLKNGHIHAFIYNNKQYSTNLKRIFKYSMDDEGWCVTTLDDGYKSKTVAEGRARELIDKR